MRDNKWIAILAALTAFGSGLATVLCLNGGLGPRVDPAPFQAVGRVLAQQTLSLLKPGGQIILITRDTTEFQIPAMDIQFATFRGELAKAGARIDSVEALHIRPLDVIQVPSDDFLRWIKHAAKGSVIVSFMGPPVLSEGQLAQLGESKPAIVAFCSGPLREQVDLRGLFSQGLLQAAVVPKRGVKLEKTRAGSDREVFDRQFLLVTSANLATLSALNPSP